MTVTMPVSPCLPLSRPRLRLRVLLDRPGTAFDRIRILISIASPCIFIIVLDLTS